MQVLHNMTAPNDTDDADTEHMPYNAAVVYHKTEFILSDLKHFEEYSIEVSTKKTEKYSKQNNTMCM